MVGNWTVAVQAALLLGAPTAPSPPAPQEGSDPTAQEIVVNGYPIRCHPRPNDPLDAVSAAAPTQNWYFVVPKPGGGYRYEREAADRRAPDDDFTRLDRWRRAGDELPAFVFRQPDDGTPLCIGKRPHTPSGTVQLQQQLRTDPYRCRSIRFTMFAASRKADARIWLNGGGNPVLFPFSGNHGWVPIKIEYGPVEWGAPWVGFGVIAGDGDIWFYDPKLAIIPDAELSGRVRRLQHQCLAALDRANRFRSDHPDLAAKYEHPRP